jgi:hypothetical protein
MCDLSSFAQIAGKARTTKISDRSNSQVLRIGTTLQTQHAHYFLAIPQKPSSYYGNELQYTAALQYKTEID